MSNLLKDISFLASTPKTFASPWKYLICSLHYIFHPKLTLINVNSIHPVLIVPITPGGEEGQVPPSQPLPPMVGGTNYAKLLSKGDIMTTHLAELVTGRVGLSDSSIALSAAQGLPQLT